MKEAVRWLVVLGILMVTFGLPVLLQQYISPAKKTSQNGQNTVEENKVIFVSVPPEIAMAGNKYLYAIDVKDSKGSEITITIKDKPSWLIWQTESKTLLGVVPEGVQSFTVSLEANNGTGEKASQSFTVVVEQPQVKGVSTNEQWADPFHPPQSKISPLPSATPSVLAESSPMPTDVLGVSSTSTPLSESERTRFIIIIAALLFFAGIFASRLIALIFTKNKTYFEGVVVQRGRSS